MPIHPKDRSKTTIELVGALAIGKWGKIEPGPNYIGESTTSARGCISAVKHSMLRPCLYYSITSGGQLTAGTVRYDTKSNLRYRHRSDPKSKNPLAIQIEDDIYLRHLGEAKAKLKELKQHNIADALPDISDGEEILFLEDCLRIHDPILSDEWAINSLPDNNEDAWEYAINTFKKDLQFWSYRIPPDYKFPLEMDEPILASHLTEEEKSKYPMIYKLNESFVETPEPSESSDASSAESKTKKSYNSSVPDKESESPFERKQLTPIVTTREEGHSPLTPPHSATHNNPTPTNPFFSDPHTESTNPFLSDPHTESTNPFLSDPSPGEHTESMRSSESSKQLLSDHIVDEPITVEKSSDESLQQVVSTNTFSESRSQLVEEPTEMSSEELPLSRSMSHHQDKSGDLLKRKFQTLKRMLSYHGPNTTRSSELKVHRKTGSVHRNAEK
ncbi:hypothetical protein BDB01DRAFT_227407 [Pilobolus umbonatus]|nr:hypothetical protein BDB01DRAFT_227407 [Pilobolus umbonatus]